MCCGYLILINLWSSLQILQKREEERQLPDWGEDGGRGCLPVVMGVIKEVWGREERLQKEKKRTQTRNEFTVSRLYTGHFLNFIKSYPNEWWKQRRHRARTFQCQECVDMIWHGCKNNDSASEYDPELLTVHQTTLLVPFYNADMLQLQSSPNAIGWDLSPH